MTYYSPWRFDAGTREIALFLSTHPVTGHPTTITASWTLLPSLNFYREMYHLTGWEPVNGQYGDTTLESGDYIVFDERAAASMSHQRFTSLFADLMSGAVVAMHR